MRLVPKYHTSACQNRQAHAATDRVGSNPTAAAINQSPTPHFPLVQTVRTHGSGPCDRGSSPRREAIDNLGCRTAPLVISGSRMGHGSAARRRSEQGMEPGQEPRGEPPAGGETDWKAMAHKWERLAGEVELGEGQGLRRAGGGHRGSHHARDPAAGQARRRAGQGPPLGEGAARVGR